MSLVTSAARNKDYRLVYAHGLKPWLCEIRLELGLFY
jgi:hypothetical protein